MWRAERGETCADTAVRLCTRSGVRPTEAQGMAGVLAKVIQEDTQLSVLFGQRTPGDCLNVLLFAVRRNSLFVSHTLEGQVGVSQAEGIRKACCGTGTCGVRWPGGKVQGSRALLRVRAPRKWVQLDSVSVLVTDCSRLGDLNNRSWLTVAGPEVCEHGEWAGLPSPGFADGQLPSVCWLPCCVLCESSFLFL